MEQWDTDSRYFFRYGPIIIFCIGFFSNCFFEIASTFNLRIQSTTLFYETLMVIPFLVKETMPL